MSDQNNTNATQASASTDTAPEDRIPFLQKVIYGIGAFVNNLLAVAIGNFMVVLNLGMGINPAVANSVAAIARLGDAITDPLVGFWSDNLKTRWGRRRPLMFVGAILAGICFALLWQLPVGKSASFYFWYLLIGSMIFYLAYTLFATPWVAMGYEMTPDYNERTRLMAVQNFIAQIPYMIGPWFAWIMTNEYFFDSMVEGAAKLSIVIAIIAIGLGIIPAIFIKERPIPVQQDTERETSIEAEAVLVDGAKNTETAGQAFWRGTKAFFGGFATTLSFKPFLKLCLATFLIFNSFMLVAQLQQYVMIYYVFDGDKPLGFEYAGYEGTTGAVSTLVVIWLVQFFATRYGKRKTFVASMLIAMVGYALKWVCYSKATPWLVVLPQPLAAFALGALFTLMPSMIADVVDADELNTRERREGMYGSIFWWTVKLGMSLALLLAGFLLNWTGFDEALGGNQTEQALFLMRLADAFIPFVATGAGLWAILTFSITEKRANEIRAELEARRGTAEAASTPA